MIIQDQDIKLDIGHVERGKMKLKKLVKKILKEQGFSGPTGTLHVYSGCSLGQLYSGAGSSANNSVMNQHPMVGNTWGSYKQYLQGPNTGGSSVFNLAEVLNNNNVIHQVWGTPSQGQVIKMYTCPPTAENCQPTCMKYEGPVGIYQLTDAENLDQVNAQEVIEPTYDLYTFGNASNLGLPMTDQNPTGYGTLGTFNSCNECGAQGDMDPEQGYSCKSGNEGAGCVPCPKNIFPMGGGVPGCPFVSLEECEASGCEENPIPFEKPLLDPLKTKPIKPIKPIIDKEKDPQKTRMQKLANIEPLKEQQEDFIINYQNCQNYTSTNQYTGNPEMDPIGCCFTCNENSSVGFSAAVASPGSINYYNDPNFYDTPPTGTCDGIMPIFGQFPNFNAANMMFEGGMQHPTLLNCYDPCDNIPEGCCEKCQDPNMLSNHACYPYCQCCDTIPVKYACSAGGQCISSTNPNFPFESLEECEASGCGADNSGGISVKPGPANPAGMLGKNRLQKLANIRSKNLKKL